MYETGWSQLEFLSAIHSFQYDDSRLSCFPVYSKVGSPGWRRPEEHGKLRRGGIEGAAREVESEERRGQLSFEEGRARTSLSPSASGSASAPTDDSGAALGAAAGRMATPNSGGVFGGGGGGGNGGSHFEQQGSAWQNVHAKEKLRLLLAGLVSDYGVKELLGGHHIVGVRVIHFISFLTSIVFVCDSLV